MKLNKITIQNFRCFKQYEVEFAPGTTVLIGKNGAGKSSLIQAIKQGVSFIFSKDKDVIEPSQSLSASASYLNVIDYKLSDAYFNGEDYQYPISIACQGTFQGKELPAWSIYKEVAGGKLDSKRLKEAYECYAEQHNQEETRSILAYFSDSYPHVESSIPEAGREILESGKSNVRNFSYYQWADDTACTTIWEHRFINTWKEINNLRTSIDLIEQSLAKRDEILPRFESEEEMQQYLSSLTEESRNKFHEELKTSQDRYPQIKKEIDALRKQSEELSLTRAELYFVIQKLKQFCEIQPTTSGNPNFEISSIRVTNRYLTEAIELEFSNGKQILFSELPAGYRRLLSIVFDIAYRSFILNGNVESNIHGLVIIDEIDLHLHPSLEQEVLERLQRTFPNIQFIVSTHSPLVITNLKSENGKNRILQIIEGQPTPDLIPDIYGINYNTGLSDIMDTPAQNTVILFIMDSIIRLTRRGKPEKTKQLREELKKLVSAARFTELEKEIENRLSM